MRRFQQEDVAVSNEESAQSPFSVLPHMRKRFADVERSLTFKARTLTQWRAWHRKLRRKLRELTGYATMQRGPLQPELTESVEVDDLIRERVEIQTEPGVIMPFYVLRLKELEGPLPAVLCPHGHGSTPRTDSTRTS